MSEESGQQRIDKWLWFARLAKTRTIAQKLVTGGHVRVNRIKTDASSRLVRPGDVLTLALERQVRIIKITQIGARRGPAPEAQALYEDLTPPAPPETLTIASHSGGPRPTKRDRRVIDAWNSPSDPTEGTSFPLDEEP